MFGKYRLLELVASGGMAEVWRAEAPGAEGFVKEVALKLIRGDHDARGDFVEMFIQEARLVSRLSHANIVQVFDFDQIDGRYYIAMELVRGRTLRDVVDRCRELGIRLGVARAVHICAEVARALAYAHRFAEGGSPAGLVHRDVSPQNVLLSHEGEVKLTDFGIARALGAAEVTAPGIIKGKLAYMAPEQARGESVDGRADVFAVGVMLWELCTGRRLFARDSDAATLAAVVSPQPLSPPSAWNEAVPPELDALALAALENDVARRTATAEELAAALASIRLRLATGHEDLDLRAFMLRLWPDGATQRAPLQPDRTLVRAPLASAASEDLSTRTAAHLPGQARSRGWAIALSAMAVALVGVSGWEVWKARASPAASSSTASAEPPRSRDSAPDRGERDQGFSAEPSPPRAPASAAPAEPSLPRAPASAAPAEPSRSRDPAPVRDKHGQGSTSTSSAAPNPASTQGEGRIVVKASPWAFVTIDGAQVGEAPVEMPFPAGVHRLHARHPSLGEDEIVVNLAPGQRYVWRPKLSR